MAPISFVCSGVIPSSDRLLVQSRAWVQCPGCDNDGPRYGTVSYVVMSGDKTPTCMVIDVTHHVRYIILLVIISPPRALTSRGSIRGFEPRRTVACPVVRVTPRAMGEMPDSTHGLPRMSSLMDVL